MNRFIPLLCLIAFLSCPCMAQQGNSAERPIIFVHGFLGWGRESGFAAYTSSVGPISSNHDRACELFYQIKGGRVDYGASHVAEFPHNRFGRTCPGLYPKWDRNHPVHIVSHSMGGQTARLLVELLAQDYFGAGTDETWVKSVVTLAAPHDGTTLATMVDGFAGGFTEQLVGGFLAIVGTDWTIYDFDLGHWNLTPRPGESLHDFLVRVDTLMDKNRRDFALHDLKPQGAKELNARVRTFPNVYYLSYSTQETEVEDEETGFHTFCLEMNPIFWPFAHYMGRYQGNEVPNCKYWWQNDGVVNHRSMKGPGGADVVPFLDAPLPGVWNWMGELGSRDHGKIIGHYLLPFSGDWLYGFYRDLAERLRRLP